MASSPHRLSLFSQPLDRAVYVAYFLGAVLPLVALAWVGQRLAATAEPDERLVPLEVFLGLGVLSLASFFALRRTTHQALRRLDTDNRRLAVLLEASSALHEAEHDQEAMQRAVDAAVRLAGSGWAVYLEARPEGSEPQLRSSSGSGARKLLERTEGELRRLARTAAEEERSVSEALPGSALWHGSPVWATALPVAAGAGRAGALLSLQPGKSLEESSTVGALGALATLAAMLGAALRAAELEEVQRNFYTHATHLLVAALDAHLDYMGEHSAEVAGYSMRLGRALDLDDDQLKRLHAAALLHDLGMLRIDRAQTELAVLRTHPALGAEMLRPVRLWEELAPIVLHHHEWWDGRGYPDGLAGESTPIESRIIGLAEAFDSMTSAASYQRPCSVEEACGRIEQAAGEQFDPQLAEIFVGMARRGELGV